MTDEHLIAEARTGSRQAFETLFERYRQPIWAFFRRRTADASRADELAQDTFVALLQGAPRYEARATFRTKRLIELIQTRTGRVSDVLEGEREIARIRTEAERLDAQRKNLQRRVDYAIIVLDVAEEARASVTLGPQPVSARLRLAVANGLSSALSSLLSVALLVLRAGPAIVLWTMLVGLPAWWFVRRRRYAAR